MMYLVAFPIEHLSPATIAITKMDSDMDSSGNNTIKNELSQSQNVTRIQNTYRF